MNSNKANNAWLCPKGIFQDVKKEFDMSKVTEYENSSQDIADDVKRATNLKSQWNNEKYRK